MLSRIYLFTHIHVFHMSVIQAIFSPIAGWLVNTELKRMFNEAAVAKFDELCCNVPGGTEENPKQFTSSPSN